jgi:hypothetical protein
MPIFPSSIQDWPTHVIGKHLQYIHLALIEPGAPLSQKELAEFFCQNSLLGKVDRIVAKKMEIEVSDMLEPLPTSMPNPQKGLRILVNGAPGVGKTTFSRKLCKDWGQGCVLEALQQYELVVLLELRERRLAKATQIDDLFPHLNPVLHKQVVKQIHESEGEKILLIIDGYDELGLRKQSLYKKIVEGEILQKCTVIITSRQYASEDLLQHVHRHVEVLGFTEKDIEKSISASIPDKTKAAQLCELLQQRQDLTSLCYIPLVCAIVAHVYMEEGYILPNTLTELYSKLVINLAKRNAKLWNDCSLSGRINDLQSLTQPAAHQLCVLSEMAYVCLTQENPKLVFYYDDLDKMPFYSHEKETHTMGLITTVNSYSLYSDKRNYQFLHLTLQEFLAAWWIANKLSPEQQGAFFNDNQQNDRLQLVLVFLAGISKLEAPQYSQVFQREINFTDKTDFQYLKFEHHLVSEQKQKLASSYHLEAQRFLVRLLYLHEAQRSELCHTLSDAVSYHIIDLHRTRLTFFHCKALGYFLAHSSCSWKALNLPVDGLSDQSIALLQSHNISSESNVQVLTFTSGDTKVPVSYNDFSQNVICSIVANALFNDCREIRLSYRHSTSSKRTNAEDPFASLFCLQKLESLTVSRKLEEPESDASYRNFQIDEFGREMKIAKSLRVLHMHRCGLDSYAIQVLANALKTSTTLEELTLCYSNLVSDGSSHLFSALATNNTVKHLDLTGNTGLTVVQGTCPYSLNQSVQALEQMLTINKTLERLNLNACLLHGTAIEALARGLAHNMALQYLSIDIYFDPERGVLIIPDSVGILAALNMFKALQVNSTLKSIYLAFRFDRQVEYSETLGASIENMLINNKHLECLSISLVVNGLSVINYDLLSLFEESIAAGLRQNSVLTELYVYGQLFTPEACKSLCSTLKLNKSLRKVCIDVAYDEIITEIFADMLLCNTSLAVLDTCHLIHKVRDMNAMILVHGLEMPRYMKTDRGNPDIEPLVREGLEKVDKAMNFKRWVTEMREASVAQGLVDNPADPIPLTMRGRFGIAAPSASDQILPLDSRNVFPRNACIRIINSLTSNHYLRELHLPCSLSEEGSLKLITKALLETTACNSSLTEVTIHNDGRTALKKHQFDEFRMILRNGWEANQQWMKQFGHGEMDIHIRAPPGNLIFKRTWTKLFDVKSNID